MNSIIFIPRLAIIGRFRAFFIVFEWILYHYYFDLITGLKIALNLDHYLIL